MVWCKWRWSIKLSDVNEEDHYEMVWCKLRLSPKFPIKLFDENYDDHYVMKCVI